MQSTINLEEQFSYSSIPLIITLILIIIVLIPIIFKQKPKKIKPIQKETYQVKNINLIKDQYLKKIDAIYNDINSNKIQTRYAYNKLSLLIRNFILEVTGIDLLKSTLSEIKVKDMGILYELIKEYYEPEFSLNNKGDIISSINKTRKVVEQWK